MRIDKCPACANSKIKLAHPVSFKENVEWELLHETFLCCDLCGTVYWPSMQSYFVQAGLTLVYYLIFCAIFFVLDSLFGLPYNSVFAVLLSFWGSRYVHAKCLAHSSWKRVVIKPGNSAAPSRLYGLAADLCGLMIALIIVISIIA